MTSISTEGIGGFMRYNKKAGIVIFAVLIAIALADEYLATSLTVSDSDFTTYIAVPLLMLPLLALFIGKEDIVPKVGRRDIAIGIFAFVALFFILVFLRLNLSYVFIDMRVDMLLFPLMIAALASFLFGAQNISKFKFLMVYSLFASPALLLVLAGVNLDFAAFNTVLIFNIIKLIFPNSIYIAPITISANTYTIGIGETCVGIGVLISTVMFLAPLAYMYNGRTARKGLWIASGFALMLLLNIMRMLGIAIAWFFYGPSNAILTIHIFAGILLFYISIVVMILAASRYGLSFPYAIKQKRKAYIKNNLGIGFAVAAVLIYVLLLSDYPGAKPASALVISENAQLNVSHAGSIVNLFTNQSRFNVTAIQNYPSNYISIALTNGTYNLSHPIGLLISGVRTNDLEFILRNATLIGEQTFLSNKSVSQQVYYLDFGGNNLLAYTEVIPYVYGNGTSTELRVFAVMPANLTPSSIKCPGYYNWLYTGLGNIFSGGNQLVNSKIMSAYCIAEGLVGK
ncbi:MAG: archaeosortase/exosortase family protein [Candidatus Micrarchaeaceae archaeon]